MIATMLFTMKMEKLIRAWQNGDDIYRVIKDITFSIGIGLSYKEITFF